MIELKGKYTSATIYADSVEEAVYSQVYDIINCKAFEGQKVVLMPDAHGGKSGPCGLVATIGNYVCPEHVGCLDMDTEILTPSGWIKISEYKDQQILQYDLASDTARFILPKLYIKKPCDEFYHFYSKDNTLDQMVSAEHKMLVFLGHKKHFHPEVRNPEFFCTIKSLEKGYYRFKTSFYTGEEGINIPDELIRIDVMVQADGYINKWKDGSRTTARIHVRKERKIKRAKELLKAANIEFSESICGDGTIVLKFHVPNYINKDLTKYYKANLHQLAIVAEECLNWDGHKGYRSYYTCSNKANSDVIQFAFAATNIRASMFLPKHKQNHNQCYSVIPTRNNFVGYTKPPVKVKSVDGFKYCFTTDTGFFVCRRNNYIFITGNCDAGCSVSMMLLDKKIPAEKYAEFEHRVKKLVPFGVNLQERTIIDEKDFRRFLTAGFNRFRNMWPEMLSDLPDQVTEKWISEQLKRLGMEEAVFYKSLGTVGSGNHYIEYDEEENGELAGVNLHFGSRNFGIKVCKYWMRKATLPMSAKEMKIATEDFKEKYMFLHHGNMQGFHEALLDHQERLKQRHITGYVHGEYLRGYLCDLCFAQLYAQYNHKTVQGIISDILRKYGIKVDRIITSTHNYIDLQDHTLRKSAIRAYVGEEMLVPFNMRDGIAICEGKSNGDWLNSCAHGAGRKMSRAAAKRDLSLEEFKKTMEGVYSTTVCPGTLDESPMAYKDTEEIVRLIQDTCTIKAILKPRINIKATNGGEEVI